MAGLSTPMRFVVSGCHNLKIHNKSLVTLYGCKVQFLQSNLYSSNNKTAKNAELDDKKRKFQELEEQYSKMLCIEQMTTDERKIHVLHAEAVAKGHFTYDDPWLNEKVLTRLRHFLKGKCCGKSCRHCIYDHSAVVDEKKKSQARFNSSFWVYDGEEEEDSIDSMDSQHAVTYGRGPYPRKYAKNAPENMIRIPSKPQSMTG